MRTTLWAAPVAALLLSTGIAACGTSTGAPAPNARTAPSTTDTSPAPSAVPSTADPSNTVATSTVPTSTAAGSPSATYDLGTPEELARGIDVPWGLTFLPGGDALIAERDTGRILRLTPGGDPAPGNPTPGSPVYSRGHRNVQGLAWDAEGRLFATEFGQNDLDEVDLIQPGRNYGWPRVEGKGDTAGGRYTDPLVTWPVSEASPSGMAIAGSTAYVAALRGERLWAVPLNGGTAGEPAAHLDGRYGRLRTVQVAPDGALWVTTSNTDGRGDLRDGDDRVLRFPAR
ncbi:PQQ-dependent sugar dehydrogenase [Nonomuraea gerenzanensis]|uniref:Glucose/Sorbosone dehydrogenase domain-containing protein n=1 Tax=Nonomuraea gerenzanensis TaxID=93944 RepID=A0A1M4ECY4_9ACTN|nr:PQQ-dependent sugar dehydrogenase [Nonomuraea gerenzanensis]SBO96528.1 hypothetical protein BN4615_P6044 [Nonomuraea gerenzanensis]